MFNKQTLSWRILDNRHSSTVNILLIYVITLGDNWTIDFNVEKRHVLWPNNSTFGIQFSSVHFSRSVVSSSLRPHESQHARPPCSSQTPRVYSNSCPSCRWWHPAILSPEVPFFSCPQSFPASGSFQMSQLFTSDGQSIGVSASASVLPMNTQDSSPSEWTGWISLKSKGLSGVFPNTTVQKHHFFDSWHGHQPCCSF